MLSITLGYGGLAADSGATHCLATHQQKHMLAHGVDLPLRVFVYQRSVVLLGCLQGLLHANLLWR